MGHHIGNSQQLTIDRSLNSLYVFQLYPSRPEMIQTVAENAGISSVSRRAITRISPISWCFVAFCVHYQPRPLRSTGVTRLHHYYGPLRHPLRPSLSLAGVRFRVTRPHRGGFPCCVRSPCAHMPGFLSFLLVSARFRLHHPIGFIRVKSLHRLQQGCGRGPCCVLWALARGGASLPVFSPRRGHADSWISS
jgi:hypothetical protein